MMVLHGKHVKTKILSAPLSALILFNFFEFLIFESEGRSQAEVKDFHLSG